MGSRQKFVTLCVSGILSFVLATLLSASVALAGGTPNAAASCVGQEAAGISPAGSSDEFPGGVPQLGQEVRTAYGSIGAVFSSFAQVHGTHEACDVGG